MEPTTGGLASGGYFSVGDGSLEIVGPDGDVLATFDLKILSSVHRSGQVITLGRSAASDVTITPASLLDADRLEAAIRNSTGLVASEPIRNETIEPTGGGSGRRILLFGGLGCIGIIVLGCLGFFALALLADDEEDDPEPVVSRDEPDVGDEVVANIGDSVELSADGWIITVTDVRKTQSTEFLFGEENALGIYLIVDMTLENTAKEAHKLTGQRFTIVDDQDRVYEWYSDGTIGYGQQELGSNINAGLSAPATILFDVPPDASGLVLESLGGFRVSLGDVEDVPVD